MKRALHLMEELGCGKVSRTHFDVNTGNSIDPTPMTVSVSKVNGVLGIEVPEAEILRIMKNLNFAPEINGDELTIQVPAYREDMLPEGERTMSSASGRGRGSHPDVRLRSRNRYLPFRCTGGNDGRPNEEQKGELALKNTLCTMGIYECMHYTFFSPCRSGS